MSCMCPLLIAETSLLWACQWVVMTFRLTDYVIWAGQQHMSCFVEHDPKNWGHFSQVLMPAEITLLVYHLWSWSGVAPVWS